MKVIPLQLIYKESKKNFVRTFHFILISICATALRFKTFFFNKVKRNLDKLGYKGDLSLPRVRIDPSNS